MDETAVLAKEVSASCVSSEYFTLRRLPVIFKLQNKKSAVSYRCKQKHMLAFSLTFLRCDFRSERYILQKFNVSEGTNINMPARNTLVQHLALHTDPESHNAQRHRQTDGRTDGQTYDKLMPIA